MTAAKMVPREPTQPFNIDIIRANTCGRCSRQLPAAAPPYEPTQEMIDAGRSQTGCIATWRAMYAAFLRRSGGGDSHGAGRRDPVPAVDGIVDMRQRVDMPMLSNQGEADKWAAAHQCTGDETCPDARKYGAIHPAPAAEPDSVSPPRCEAIADEYGRQCWLIKGHTNQHYAPHPDTYSDAAPNQPAAASRVTDQSAAPRAEDDMCPNCVTPWKCNGPHIPDQSAAGHPDSSAPIGLTPAIGAGDGPAADPVAAMVARLTAVSETQEYVRPDIRVTAKDAAALIVSMARERDTLQNQLMMQAENWHNEVVAVKAAAAASAKDAERLRELLRELVACKDLKERIEAKTTMTAETESWRLDYERRKPLAWAAARAALAAQKGEG